tara:strand:+ start:26700 stop:27773 length:1074 start_codon:yes stop_codon:yes gene_type:complete
MKKNSKLLLVTGGCGFIGSNFIRKILSSNEYSVVNLDNLTYAGNINNLSSFQDNSSYEFIHGDIGDNVLVKFLLDKYHPDAIINFAAESHVDRSINSPQIFIDTNIVGTFNLLDMTRHYWFDLSESKKKSFLFLHVSTDEVYGSLASKELPFKEDSKYCPNSPYAASKASSDHFVRSFNVTYGLPTIITNCSNNYGPYQFPEKLIPLIINNALNGNPLPIYGDGLQIRDWIYVEDHVDAISIILNKGEHGNTYNIGGSNEIRNIDIVKMVCNALDAYKPLVNNKSYFDQVKFVKDRLGHDKRYAIDCSKINRELKWKAKVTIESGIDKTVKWYLENTTWLDEVVSGEYMNWVKSQYN